MNELKHCPSCDFTYDDFLKHREEGKRNGCDWKWEQYAPHLIPGNKVSGPHIECENCGFVAFFSPDPKEVIKRWNELPRKVRKEETK